MKAAIPIFRIKSREFCLQYNLELQLIFPPWGGTQYSASMILSSYIHIRYAIKMRLTLSRINAIRFYFDQGN